MWQGLGIRIAEGAAQRIRCRFLGEPLEKGFRLGMEYLASGLDVYHGVVQHFHWIAGFQIVLAGAG